MTPILVATVHVVFEAPDGGPSPDALASALIAERPVTTVRMADHGAPSVYRADVAVASPDACHGPAAQTAIPAPRRALTEAAVAAARIAEGIAQGLGARADVQLVTLATEAERIEVDRFRPGDPW